jgi:hypothetical protein
MKGPVTVMRGHPQLGDGNALWKPSKNLTMVEEQSVVRHLHGLINIGIWANDAGALAP